MPKVTETKTEIQNCVECGGMTTFVAQRSGHTFDVQELPRKRGQTCEGWNGHTCRRTSRVVVTVTKIDRQWTAAELDAPEEDIWG